MTRILSVFSLLMALCFVGCSSFDESDWNDDSDDHHADNGSHHEDNDDDHEDDLDRDEVVGIQWTATWLWDGTIVEEAPPTLLLQNDGRIAGFAGVNQFFGNYTINEERGGLRMRGFGSTLMAGPDDRMAQESAYIKLLERVKAARVNRHGELELLDRGDVLVRLEPTSDAVRYGLVGREWELFRLRGEKPVNNSNATIEFKSDGSFAGHASVNRYFGKYTKDDRTGRIRLSDIGSTKMAGEERLMKQEERLLASLRAVDHFSFTEDGDLLLHNADNIAARFRVKKND